MSPATRAMLARRPASASSLDKMARLRVLGSIASVIPGILLLQAVTGYESGDVTTVSGKDVKLEVMMHGSSVRITGPEVFFGADYNGDLSSEGHDVYPVRRPGSGQRVVVAEKLGDGWLVADSISEGWDPGTAEPDDAARSKVDLHKRSGPKRVGSEGAAGGDGDSDPNPPEFIVMPASEWREEGGWWVEYKDGQPTGSKQRERPDASGLHLARYRGAPIRVQVESSSERIKRLVTRARLATTAPDKEAVLREMGLGVVPPDPDTGATRIGQVLPNSPISGTIVGEQIAYAVEHGIPVRINSDGQQDPSGINYHALLDAILRGEPSVVATAIQRAHTEGTVHGVSVETLPANQARLAEYRTLNLAEGVVMDAVAAAGLAARNDGFLGVDPYHRVAIDSTGHVTRALTRFEQIINDPSVVESTSAADQTVTWRNNREDFGVATYKKIDTGWEIRVVLDGQEALTLRVNEDAVAPNGAPPFDASSLVSVAKQNGLEAFRRSAARTLDNYGAEVTAADWSGEAIPRSKKAILAATLFHSVPLRDNGSPLGGPAPITIGTGPDARTSLLGPALVTVRVADRIYLLQRGRFLRYKPPKARR